MTNPKATELADGLRALAAMIEQSSDEAVYELRYTFDHISVPVWSAAAAAALARAGMHAGAKVTKHQSDKYAGVDIAFGRVSLHVYADREEICERVVTGTETVTKKIKDPEALAAVPEIEVTEEVEKVEWRCRPLLEDRADEPETASAR